MQRSGNNLIQTIEWKEDMPVSSGNFFGVNLIHCVEDGNVKAMWKSGNTFSRSFVAGDDFSLDYIDITVESGSFDIN